MHRPNERSTRVPVADTEAAFDAFDEDAQGIGCGPGEHRRLNGELPTSMGMFRFQPSMRRGPERNCASLSGCSRSCCVSGSSLQIISDAARKPASARKPRCACSSRRR